MSIIDFIFEDDLQLAVSMEEKNVRSMDYFYDTYSAALYGMIYKITNKKPLAEECLKATFVKAWNDIAAFRSSGTSLFSWLLRLARQSVLEVVVLKTEKNPGTQNYVNGLGQHYSAFELVYFK